MREQLNYERLQNKELIETITSLVKPAPVNIIKSDGQQPQAIPRGMTFSRRRGIIEAADRIQAARIKTSPVAAKPDNELKADPKIVEQIAKLEKELELPTETENDDNEQHKLHGENRAGEHTNGQGV
ncbi:MAG TPA: hypothetical protein VGK47_08185 [Nitrososphaeraceae archaeon]